MNQQEESACINNFNKKLNEAVEITGNICNNLSIKTIILPRINTPSYKKNKSYQKYKNESMIVNKYNVENYFK